MVQYSSSANAHPVGVRLTILKLPLNEESGDIQGSALNTSLVREIEIPPSVNKRQSLSFSPSTGLAFRVIPRPARALRKTTKDGLHKVPTRAASDQGDIHAFALNAEQWAELKATYRGLNLHMPCCGVAAVPKTSLRGNYFFAHARRGECATADESPEHLYCKSLIAKAALDAGWAVTTERQAVPRGTHREALIFPFLGNTMLA